METNGGRIQGRDKRECAYRVSGCSSEEQICGFSSPGASWSLCASSGFSGRAFISWGLLSGAERCRPFCDRNTTRDEFFKSSRLAALQLSQFFFTKQFLFTKQSRDREMADLRSKGWCDARNRWGM